MVQLKVLSGKKAGTAWVARRFPVRIGRSAAADLQLEEGGVWDQHLQLDFNPAEGIVLSAQPNALATVNGQPVHQTVLRNGDAIDIGSLRMQFWLSETRQAGLALPRRAYLGWHRRHFPWPGRPYLLAAPLKARSTRLMPEVPCAGKRHRQVALVRSRNHFGIAH